MAGESDMTPAEFAEAHGLSLEEAELVIRAREAKLAREAVAAYKAKHEPTRLEKAMAALAAAQKKVGVHPVQEGYFDDLHRVYDPEAEQGLDKFYSTKAAGGRELDSNGYPLPESKPTWKERNAWQADENGYPVDQSEGGADE